MKEGIQNKRQRRAWRNKKTAEMRFYNDLLNLLYPKYIKEPSCSLFLEELQDVLFSFLLNTLSKNINLYKKRTMPGFYIINRN